MSDVNQVVYELCECTHKESPLDNVLQSKHHVSAWYCYYVPCLTWIARGLKRITEGYSRELMKWLQTDGESSLGKNFGRRNRTSVCLFASQPRLCLPQQPFCEDEKRVVLLSSSLTRLSGSGPCQSLLSCPLRPGFAFSFTLQALSVTRVP